MRTCEGEAVRAGGVRPAASSRRASTGFTLVEALVSISIAAAMLLMIAMIFRQSSQVARQARAGAVVHQVARQVFEQLGRDLAGSSVDGFIFLRCQSRNWDGGDWHTSGFISFYVDEDGNVRRLYKARTDMLVLLSSGYYTSAVNGGKVSSAARIIWGQTERVNGTDNDCPAGRTNQLLWGPPEIQAVYTQSQGQYLLDTPGFQGKNQVLAREQTLLLPDTYAVGDSHSGNRGPDYYNMGFNDLNRFFWPAMSGVDALFLYGDTFDWKPGPNNYIIGGSSQLLLFCYEDLMPWRTASKVFRLGRDGPGIDGESAGHEGAGDLTAGMVNQEPPNILTDGRFPTEKYRGSSWSYNYASGGYSTVYSDGTYNNCTSAGWRGHERPRIYGPKDYHRLMAFGVPVFQIDWTDGRRDQDRRLIYSPEYMPWTNVSIPAMHTNGDLERCYQWKFGPGPPIDYCWNFHSPEHVRNMNLKITRGVSPEAHVGPQNGPDCGPWGQGGSDYYGMSGWARPKALRVRLMIADPSTDPPQAYEFSETYTLLAQ